MESLASKMRPKCFAEVIGQQSIIGILSRQVATKTFKNVYLFVGPSGCGKTTVARIMAYAVNNGEGEPIEMDGASNNGINQAREIILDSQQTSLDSEYKVYIIDECHQLTSAAWDALLKTLEEPASNVIFIFCTTNPSKLPITIKSRAQRFDFKRVPTQIIADRLEYIMNEEFPDIIYEKEALYRIAVKADGYVREAITLLDKCISCPDGVTLKSISEVIGIIQYEVLFNYLNALINKNSQKALEIINTLKMQESNLMTIYDNILEYFISCAKFKLTNDIALCNLPKQYTDNLKNIEEDLMPFVERAFKYRQLLQNIDADTLLSVLTLELCRR